MGFSVDEIKGMIYVIRGYKVMLDRDLALLYEVETKRLNEQVRRNIDRFPKDFMFQLNSEEFTFLKSQFATSKGRGGKQKKPFVFTENGIAMLSGVLNSKRAILVNIAIMRTFTKLRSFLAMESSVESRMNDLEEKTHRLFRIVFKRLDNYEDQIFPKLSPNRDKIGFKTKNKN